MINKNTRVCIVGLGLLGGSYALSLKSSGLCVTAIDKSPDVIQYAQKNEIVDNRGLSEQQRLSEADCVALTLYPRDIVPWFTENAAYLKSGCIVTDVTGVKGDMVLKAQRLLPKGVEFVSCHPMAGREVSGVENASAQMLCGANFLITPTECNTANGIAFMKSMAQLMGFGKISVLSPGEHDKMIGYVSQLTHAIAVSLMNATDNTHLADYTGDSFRDLTRIARINENMWSELFLQNSEILISEIDLFCTAMQGLKQKLVSNDENGLKELFITSTKRRAVFDKK